jgi:alginate O-acetyltransferase complex protein AlgI
MGFNSLDYFIFLFIVFIIFWQFHRQKNIRIVFLLISSYFFYFAWNGIYVFLLILSTVIDFSAGYYIGKFNKNRKLKKLLLVISIFSNFFILFLFKYSNFFIENINILSELFGENLEINKMSLILPVGISFYTFQSLSYTLDIYFGKINPKNSFKDFFLFVSFFPQLIAGPIVRASEFLPQLKSKPILTNKNLGEGIFTILKGLIKKVIIADFLAYSIVDPTFNSYEVFSSMEVFISLVAFHFQVYCDFSGYTDIALGSAKLFGFTLPENFKTPYIAHSPANFWKRWHMTLSRYIFDYLYKNLGPRNISSLRKYINILIVFTIIGFWHGANWNYVLFGVYHAIGVILSHMLKDVNFKTKIKIKNIDLFRIFQILLTNIFIIFSLPLFRSTTFKEATQIYEKIFTFSGSTISFTHVSLFVLLIAIVSHYIPNNFKIKTEKLFISSNAYCQSFIAIFIAFLMFKIGEISSNSFIYFQF